MAFIIPWIFRAGTKAKSAEVNENFLAVKQFVDLLEEDVAANQIMVQTLDDTKANVNGNPTERFQVSTAIVGNDAVNLNTLEQNTQNSRGYIDGYRLSATNKVVTASKGACYSYTETGGYEYLIKSDVAIQTDTLTLANNTKYYIFVCGDSAGVDYPQLEVSTNTQTPSLPEGLDCWRRIGSLTTDDDGNIEEVLNEGEKSLLGFAGFLTSYLGEIEPFIDWTDGREYTAEENMWLVLSQSGENADVVVEFKLQETWRKVLEINSGGVGDVDRSSSMVPVKKGQEYRIRAKDSSRWYCYKYGMGG